jgi:hypothetical protein
MTTSLTARLERARRAYAALERFAARRARFLEALDWNALGSDVARQSADRTDRLMGDLADAWLYVDHLERHTGDDFSPFDDVPPPRAFSAEPRQP